MCGGATAAALITKKEKGMKKMVLLALVLMPMLAACATKCESEPIVAENHKLIVPPNFGQMPK